MRKLMLLFVLTVLLCLPSVLMAQSVATAPWSETFDEMPGMALPVGWDNSESTVINPQHLTWYCYTNNWDQENVTDNNLLCFNNTSASAGGVGITKSPLVYIPDDGSDWEFSFDYKHAAKCGPVTVAVSTDLGETFIDLCSISQGSHANLYNLELDLSESIVDFSQYAGDTVMFRISVTATHDAGSILLDNFAITRCHRLHGSVASVDGPGLTVAVEESCDWQYSIVENIDLQARDGEIVSVSEGQQSVDVFDLKPNHTYVAFVRRDCGNGEYGPWSLAMADATGCIFRMPFHEDFDYGISASLPSCWDAPYTKVAGVLDFRAVQIPGAVCDSRYLIVEQYSLEYDDDTTKRSYVVLPEIADLKKCRISFDYYTVGINDRILIGYTTDMENDDSLVALDTLPNVNSLTYYVGHLPAVPQGARLAFMADGGTGFVIDNINIYNEYQISWNNYDGTNLGIDTVLEGEVPVYMGAEPVHEAEVGREYVFVGWDPDVEVATADAVYTALFEMFSSLYEIEESAFHAFTMANTLYIDNGGTDYQVFSADGALIYSGNQSSITLPADGVYFIRIADTSLRIISKAK